MILIAFFPLCHLPGDSQKMVDRHIGGGPFLGLFSSSNFPLLDGQDVLLLGNEGIHNLGNTSMSFTSFQNFHCRMVSKVFSPH